MRASLPLRCAQNTMTGSLKNIVHLAKLAMDQKESAETVWKEVDTASSFAYQLKESDSLLSVVHSLLAHGVFPSYTAWPALLEKLLTFSNVESSSVRFYPGVEDETMRRANVFDVFRSSEGPEKASAYSVPVTRETLLLTGGVVPLSARVPCGDGTHLAVFLGHFCKFAEQLKVTDENEPQIVQLLGEMGKSIVRVLLDNQGTVQPLLLTDTFNRFTDIFFRLVENEAEEVQDQLLDFLSSLSSTVYHNALGSCLVLQYAAFKLQQTVADEVRHTREKLLLNIVHSASGSFTEDYTRFDESSGRMAPTMEFLLDALDHLFQRNTNENNAMGIEGAEESSIITVATVAFLRAMRIEQTAPDEFLRISLPVVERCPTSAAVEAELIEGKASLLDYFSLDDSEKETIYLDLVSSLRGLVSLCSRSSETECDILQRAHRTVIHRLCVSQQDTRIQDAYDIIVAHKYHGLSVTKEVLSPLTDALSRRGDGRVFNLVDLCVLYSNNEIDREIIVHLFRTCLVAGDHYRAKSLLQLLDETVPGFLLKAPEEVKYSLQRLKVIPPDPQHLFVDEEDILVNTAMGIPWSPAEPLPR